MHTAKCTLWRFLNLNPAGDISSISSWLEHFPVWNSQLSLFYLAPSFYCWDVHEFTLFISNQVTGRIIDYSSSDLYVIAFP